MSRIVAQVVALALFISQAAAAADPILNIGDAAPPVMVSAWLKGDRVRQFDPGKIYVVEFWATWCGPCRASIPHLTQLAHQYQDKIQFVGVDVWEDDASAAKPFVEQMGDKMDYAVAVDIMAASGTAADATSADAKTDEASSARGAMAKFWLDAAKENGIPTAFVIRDGKIAWIGHPMELDDPLKKILAGDWDLTAMAKQRLADKADEPKFQALSNAVFIPYRGKDYKAALAAIDQAVEQMPQRSEAWMWTKFSCLCKLEEIDSALELGDKMFEEHKDSAIYLNNFWGVVDPELAKPPDPRVARLALKAAQRAVELTHEEDANYLDTLAVAQYRTADFDAAIATEQKAIAMNDAAGKDRNESDVKQFSQHLEKFRQAAAKKADKTP